MRIYNFLFKKRICIIEIIILFLLTLSIYSFDLLSIEFQPDETFWISTSNRFDHFFDLSSPIWEENWGNYDIRPLPSYIVRVGQEIGRVNNDIPPNYWDWSKNREENIANNRMPETRILYFSRLPMAIITTISIIATTILLIVAHSRMAGYIFLVTSFFNEFFLVHLRRSMSEAPLLLFTILTIITIYKLQIAIKSRNNKSIIIWSVLIGVFSGLAGQSKLTGLACGVLAIVVSMAMIYRYGLSKQVIGERIFKIVSVTILSATTIVFIGSYPFLYKNTLLRIAGTFYTRQFVIKSQLVNYPSQLIHSNQRLSILLDRVFDYPYHLPNNNCQLVPIVVLCITVFGIYQIVKVIISKEVDANIYMILLFGMILLEIPMLFTPLDWDRYFLYPIFFTCIFSSIGIAQIIFYVKKMVKLSD